ncbi:MAG: hypothetical protein JWO35_214 [Candidatus Saccharibacteria bacterium]|nr:hypothetical protein [Candidatus Saccharibacteria bacterium]
MEAVNESGDNQDQEAARETADEIRSRLLIAGTLREGLKEGFLLSGTVFVDAAGGDTIFAGAKDTPDWREADQRVSKQQEQVALRNPQANRFYLEGRGYNVDELPQNPPRG